MPAASSSCSSSAGGASTSSKKQKWTEKTTSQSQDWALSDTPEQNNRSQQQTPTSLASQNTNSNGVDGPKFSWTLWKCWSKRINKAFEAHLGSNYVEYSLKSLGKKFYTAIQGQKLGIGVDVEFQIFEIKSIGDMKKIGQRKQLLIDSIEMRCANNMGMAGTEQLVSNWILCSHNELARALTDTLQIGDFLAVWGGIPDKKTKSLVLDYPDGISATVLAMYRHGVGNLETLFSLKEPPEYIVQQVRVSNEEVEEDMIDVTKHSQLADEDELDQVEEDILDIDVTNHSHLADEDEEDMIDVTKHSQLADEDELDQVEEDILDIDVTNHSHLADEDEDDHEEVEEDVIGATNHNHLADEEDKDEHEDEEEADDDITEVTNHSRLADEEDKDEHDEVEEDITEVTNHSHLADEEDKVEEDIIDVTKHNQVADEDNIQSDSERSSHLSHAISQSNQNQKGKREESKNVSGSEAEEDKDDQSDSESLRYSTSTKSISNRNKNRNKEWKDDSGSETDEDKDGQSESEDSTVGTKTKSSQIKKGKGKTSKVISESETDEDEDKDGQSESEVSPARKKSKPSQKKGKGKKSKDYSESETGEDKDCQSESEGSSYSKRTKSKSNQNKKGKGTKSKVISGSEADEDKDAQSESESLRYLTRTKPKSKPSQNKKGKVKTSKDVSGSEDIVEIVQETNARLRPKRTTRQRKIDVKGGTERRKRGAVPIDYGELSNSTDSDVEVLENKRPKRKLPTRNTKQNEEKGIEESMSDDFDFTLVPAKTPNSDDQPLDQIRKKGKLEQKKETVVRKLFSEDEVNSDSDLISIASAASSGPSRYKLLKCTVRLARLSPKTTVVKIKESQPKSNSAVKKKKKK